MGKLNQIKKAIVYASDAIIFMCLHFLPPWKNMQKCPLRPLSFWSFQNHSIRHIVAHF